MAKYFYDCEFLEGTQKRKFWWGNTVPTIDLISIGIVSEDGREYYAISKDFNLKEAWNRYDKVVNKHYPLGPEYNKVYWIRENVLKPIYYDWIGKDTNFHEVNHFTYKNFKRLLKLKGKSNKQIAKEICSFIDARGKKENHNDWFYLSDGSCYPKKVFTKNVELYGYYSAYDHVALCWLFGKMIDLPTGFPMYTIDLKQSFDEKAESFTTKQLTDFQYGEGFMKHDVYEPLNYMKVDYTKIDLLKKHKNYPKQTNNHNSLSDAKWNYELYKFLNGQ